MQTAELLRVDVEREVFYKYLDATVSVASSIMGLADVGTSEFELAEAGPGMIGEAIAVMGEVEQVRTEGNETNSNIDKIEREFNYGYYVENIPVTACVGVSDGEAQVYVYDINEKALLQSMSDYAGKKFGCMSEDLETIQQTTGFSIEDIAENFENNTLDKVPGLKGFIDYVADPVGDVEQRSGVVLGEN